MPGHGGVILLWGPAGDGPLDRVRAALALRGATVALVEQREVLRTRVDLWLGDGLATGSPSSRQRVGRSCVKVGRSVTRLGEIRAAYWRTYDLRRLPAIRDEAAAGRGASASEHALAVEQALLAWLENTEAAVVNRPSSMASNNSKPYQAAVLQRAGFEVPETLVTTDPEAALAFWTDHGTVIYKSVSGARSVVARLTPARAERIGDIVWCPTQFQRYVPGRDVRVHVVNDRVFASEVSSEADDYRYAARDGLAVEVRPVDVPTDVAARCVVVTRGLGMLFAGIDLRRAPDGRWFAFEANPSPGFTYYEDRTGQPIATALADLLIAGRSPS